MNGIILLTILIITNMWILKLRINKRSSLPEDVVMAIASNKSDLQTLLDKNNLELQQYQLDPSAEFPMNPALREQAILSYLIKVLPSWRFCSELEDDAISLEYVIETTPTVNRILLK